MRDSRHLAFVEQSPRGNCPGSKRCAQRRCAPCKLADLLVNDSSSKQIFAADNRHVTLLEALQRAAPAGGPSLAPGRRALGTGSGWMNHGTCGCPCPQSGGAWHGLHTVRNRSAVLGELKLHLSLWLGGLAFAEAARVQAEAESGFWHVSVSQHPAFVLRALMDGSRSAGDKLEVCLWTSGRRVTPLPGSCNGSGWSGGASPAGCWTRSRPCMPPCPCDSRRQRV